MNRWWDYVQRVSRSATQVQIAERSGIDQTTVSRWKRGTGIRPETIAAFADAYGRPRIEAFIAAGFLTEDDARHQISQALDVTALDDDELLAEVARRMAARREEGEHGGDTAPIARPLRAVARRDDPDSSGSDET